MTRGSNKGRWMELDTTYPTDPDTPRFDVQVHQIVDHATLQIILYPIDDDLTPHIDDLAVGHIALVLIQRLVHPLIHAYPLPEILRRLFGVLTLVVRTRRLDFEDIAHDDVLFIALALDENSLDILAVTALFDPTPPVFGGVRGIEDRDEVSRRAEPFAHIVDCGFGGGSA